MTKRRLAWSAITLFAFGSSLSAHWSFGNSHCPSWRSRDTETYRRTASSRGQRVKLTKATVNLLGENVQITLALEGVVLFQPFVLEATAVGTPEYKQGSRHFIFIRAKWLLRNWNFPVNLSLTSWDIYRSVCHRSWSEKKDQGDPSGREALGRRQSRTPRAFAFWADAHL